MGELEAIRTFLTVAEHSSFSAAARLLGMTPASVTRTISALEDNLGVQLLLRTTRKVSLTSAGAAYAARVAPLAQGIARATEETRDLQQVTAGSLRVSAPMSLSFPDSVICKQMLFCIYSHSAIKGAVRCNLPPSGAPRSDVLAEEWRNA